MLRHMGQVAGQPATLYGTIRDKQKIMAKVSISAAAKLAGVSRSTLYRSYIDKGKISLSKDQRDNPCIDTSELLRVFGALQGTVPQSDSAGQVIGTARDSMGQAEKNAKHALEVELKLVKKQLEEAKEREAWYKAKIDTLTDSLKLLEGPKTSPKSWWQFWK